MTDENTPYLSPEGEPNRANNKGHDEEKEKVNRRRAISLGLGATLLTTLSVGSVAYYGQYGWNFDKANEDLKYFVDNGHFPPVDKFKPPVNENYDLLKDVDASKTKQESPQPTSSAKKPTVTDNSKVENNPQIQEAKNNAVNESNEYPVDGKVNVDPAYLGVDTGYGAVSTDIQGLVMPGSYQQRTDTTNNARWSLSIPAIGLWSAIIPMGIVDGEIQIANSGECSWYNQSAPIGSSEGTTIIAGHVNYANAAPTVFWNLGNTPVGSIIYLTGDDGKTHKYTAVGVNKYGKNDLPKSMFTRVGDPLVKILTCTDLSINPSTGLWGFPDNLVLTGLKID